MSPRRHRELCVSVLTLKTLREIRTLSLTSLHLRLNRAGAGAVELLDTIPRENGGRERYDTSHHMGEVRGRRLPRKPGPESFDKGHADGEPDRALQDQIRPEARCTFSQPLWQTVHQKLATTFPGSLR